MASIEGCESVLDAWCARHCAGGGVGPLSARLPSTAALVGESPVIYCYETARLHHLEGVTANLSRVAPESCGELSTKWVVVHRTKITAESRSLAAVLRACRTNRTRAAAAAKASEVVLSSSPLATELQQRQWLLSTRRSQIAMLVQPLLQQSRSSTLSSAPSALLERQTAAEALAWLQLCAPGGVVHDGDGAATAFGGGDGAVGGTAGGTVGGTAGGTAGGARQQHADGQAMEPSTRASRTRARAAAACVSHGRGRWVATSAPERARGEPYLMPTDYLSRANISRWWWGVCDDDLRRGEVRPPRAAAVDYAWEPHGEGCEQLRKHRHRMPPLSVLARAFCAAHAGRSVLFIGDSIQGQLFTSFVLAAGVFHSEPQIHPRSSGVRPPRCAQDRHYLTGLAAIHEFNLDMRICHPDPARGVRARFIRNEPLWPDGAKPPRPTGTGSASTDVPGGASATAAGGATATAALPAGRGHGAKSESTTTTTTTTTRMPRSFVLCEWAQAAREADLLVLNRGMHYVDDDALTAQLAATFDTLHELRRDIKRSNTAAVGTGTDGATSPLARAPRAQGEEDRLAVVYRGVHAPIPSCHLLDDPLPSPFPYAAGAEYHWEAFGRQNLLARELAAAFNHTFLDVHQATALRPGGHMPSRSAMPGDCAHYCLPGPIDEWVRLLFALWT